MKVDFDLYLITDRRLSKRSLPDCIKEALEGGVKAVCVREKDLPGRELLNLCKAVRGLTSGYGAKLFVNDRLDAAIAAKADGVHLGGKSFRPEDVRSVSGKGMLIGVSTHSVEEAIEAEKEGADFITLGPVYHTPSKAQYEEPIGLLPLKKARRALRIPVFAIGGIKKDKIGEIKNMADGVALISAIIAALDPRGAAMEIISELKGANQ
jgi:thiamine-phosphate pyrophosphorylase